jgi:hypothetical protein
VFIPKPGRDELRPLPNPAVRDRIVQAAAKLVIEPIFEADMLARTDEGAADKAPQVAEKGQICR